MSSSLSNPNINNALVDRAGNVSIFVTNALQHINQNYASSELNHVDPDALARAVNFVSGKVWPDSSGVNLQAALQDTLHQAHLLPIFIRNLTGSVCVDLISVELSVNPTSNVETISARLASIVAHWAETYQTVGNWTTPSTGILDLVSLLIARSIRRTDTPPLYRAGEGPLPEQDRSAHRQTANEDARPAVGPSHGTGASHHRGEGAAQPPVPHALGAIVSTVGRNVPVPSSTGESFGSPVAGSPRHGHALQRTSSIHSRSASTSRGGSSAASPRSGYYTAASPVPFTPPNMSGLHTPSNTGFLPIEEEQTPSTGRHARHSHAIPQEHPESPTDSISRAADGIRDQIPVGRTGAIVSQRQSLLSAQAAIRIATSSANWATELSRRLELVAALSAIATPPVPVIYDALMPASVQFCVRGAETISPTNTLTVDLQSVTIQGVTEMAQPQGLNVVDQLNISALANLCAEISGEWLGLHSGGDVATREDRAPAPGPAPQQSSNSAQVSGSAPGSSNA